MCFADARVISHIMGYKLFHHPVQWMRRGYHFFFALGAALIHGFASRKIVVIGITGTKGKTTVVDLVHAVLSQSGTLVASTSSLRFRIAERLGINDLKMTMPGRLFIQRFLYRAVKRGCRYAVLEVTSQGIMQFRHRFIRFDTATLTNVAPEHIEAHGGFENYVAAKCDLFGRLAANGVAIINRDDPQADRFAHAARNRNIIWYGKEGILWKERRWRLEGLVADDAGIRFRINNVVFSSSLVGQFNVLNILAALAVGLRYNVSLDAIAEAIRGVSGMPGRMEFVQNEPFRIVVDYAHTPDSLKAAYSALQKSGHKLICVLGAAGGGRDTWKRPEFGKIAEQFCSSIVLTNEDPYDEDPEAIIQAIASGISEEGRQKTRLILDRRLAVRAALGQACAGDTVMITGKGAEPWIMGPKGVKTAWDDRVAAREEAAKLLH